MVGCCDKSISYTKGGVKVLDDLDDVTISGPSDDQVLTYNSTTGQWENETGGASALNDLTDVTISSASEQNILVYDSTSNQWINQAQDRSFMQVQAGENLTKGDAVYIRDVISADVVAVRKANAGSASTMPAIGIMYETLGTGEQGLAVTYGKATGVAANDAVGKVMYVSTTSAGAITAIRPTTAGSIVQNLGVLSNPHVSDATVMVTGVGRINDIPNATIATDISEMDYIYIDDGGVFKKISLAVAGLKHTGVLADFRQQEQTPEFIDENMKINQGGTVGLPNEYYIGRNSGSRRTNITFLPGGAGADTGGKNGLPEECDSFAFLEVKADLSELGEGYRDNTSVYVPCYFICPNT